MVDAGARSWHILGVFVHSPKKPGSTDAAPVRRDDLRSHNSALLLRALWASESGTSRSTLARHTGLSRATVSSIVAELLEADVVVESARRTRSGGRPGQVVRFHGTSRAVVGVEVGASHLSAVRSDLQGTVQDSVRIECNVQGEPRATVELLKNTVQQLIDTSSAPVLGIGLALPSPILRDHPGRLSTALFPAWSDIDIVAELSEATGRPVAVDNDANLGALAEHWWGAGRGRPDFAYVKVATGVGAGVILNGDVYRGSGGIAGEIGHTALDASGPACRCGLSGCLESFVGTQSLLRQAQQRHAQLTPTPNWGQPQPTLPGLIAAARSGDTEARQLIAEAGHWLGVALANLLNLINPGCIVLGGRLTRAGDLLLHPLRSAMASRALWSSVAKTEVIISTLPGEPIALGAATLWLQSVLADPTPLLQGGAPAANPTFWRSHA